MTARSFRLTTLALVGGVALLAASCGGGGSPSTPSTPTPTAQPTATPPVGGGGGVGSTSCPLGNGSVNAQCSKNSSRLLDAVYTAQDLLLVSKTPEPATLVMAVSGLGVMAWRRRRQKKADQA